MDSGSRQTLAAFFFFGSLYISNLSINVLRLIAPIMCPKIRRPENRPPHSDLPAADNKRHLDFFLRRRTPSIKSADQESRNLAISPVCSTHHLQHELRL